MKKAIQIPYIDQFDKKCRLASEAGFTEIAVHFCDFPENFGSKQSDWDEMGEHIQRCLEDNHLECVQTHPYYYDLNLSSEILIEEKEFEVGQAIILGAKLGAKWNVIHPRTSITSGLRRSCSLEDNRRTLSRYVELAVKYNTGIAVENLPIFGDQLPIIPYYGWNVEDLSDMVDPFNDDHIGVCWDTGHANVLAVDPEKAIQYLGKRITCTHIHNNYRNHDTHIPPSTGTVDWATVMKTIKKETSVQSLTLETHCGYKDDDQLLLSFASHNLECLKYLEKLAENC